MTRGLATFTVRLSLLCAVLAGLAGCAHFAPHFESPHLSVVGVEVQEASLAGQKFRVRMRVQNPNDRELPVNGIVCALKLAGEGMDHADFKRFSSAQRRKNARQPRRQHAFARPRRTDHQ